MTKEITKAIILQEIQDKFKLRDWEAERFLFSELVIPTYDISKHVQHWISDHKDVSITSAASFVFFTVPDNERWYLSRYDVTFLGAGAHTVAGVFILREPPEYVYLDLTAAQTISYHINLSMLAVINPGEYIKVNIDGYTATQDLRLGIDYMMEEIR